MSIKYFDCVDFLFVGGTRKNIRVAYRAFNPTANKGTVLIPTCFGGRISNTTNFTEGALRDYHVIVVAMLGNGESSSPSNDVAFPADYSLRYEDCVNSQYALTKSLGIESLEAVIGFSMGAQQAYYWAAMHGVGSNPYVKRAVIICGSARTSGLNYAFLEGPVSALTTSHDYDHGRYRTRGVKATEGLRAFGRAYAAWVPSAEWFRQELWRESGALSLHDWLYPSVSSYEKWDPEDLIVKVRMWQAGNIATVVGDGSLESALAEISAKVMVMPCLTDQYFSAQDSEFEVQHLRYGIYEPIPSIWGHMAGGGKNKVDLDWMDGRISRFIATNWSSD